MTLDVPVIVNVRDRLTPLRELVAWLERAGHREIWLVDNASTYPPLVDWLASTPHHVVRCGTNLGHRAPWLSGVVADVGADRFFVVSDPDVVPADTCPLDAVGHFRSLFEHHPGIDKIGFGLRIDDLPVHYAHADAVRSWEAQFWTDEVEPGVYRAAVDTTFCLYRPGLGHRDDNALRTGEPYVARHVPWYTDSANLTEEDRYYREHADPLTSNWDREVLPGWKLAALLGLDVG
jgi:hypothetical protein